MRRGSVRPGIRCALALLCAVAAGGCERQVTVHPEGTADNTGSVANPATMMPGQTASAGQGSAAPAGTAGGRSNPGDPALPPDMPSATPLGDAGEAGQTASTSVMDGIDQTAEGSQGHIEDVQVLAVFLSAIELPAVGSEGVSLTQYFGTDQAATLYVDWGGSAEYWHLRSRAYYIDTAASQSRHIGVLYAMGSYGIHEADRAAEISGTPASYKEYLAANPQGFAWVDYPIRGAGMAPGGGQALGPIVFRTWTGEERAISDAQRYRARLELSDTHAAFVEYADTAPGTVGQIVVQPLDGGAPILAAASPNHQDRPSIDGDWVVWEEYVGAKDSVIRARHLATGELRDLSSVTGFRTNPDILGTRVVWEDQRTGDGDIYFTDLGDDAGERVAVSGAGHSAGVRLAPDGLVWIESSGGQIALLRASWRQ